mgnify:CR=1 FL=1
MAFLHKLDNSSSGDQVGAYCVPESSRGFTVIEAFVMLVVLSIFTLIVIALLIRESGEAKDEVQGRSVSAKEAS